MKNSDTCILVVGAINENFNIVIDQLASFGYPIIIVKKPNEKLQDISVQVTIIDADLALYGYGNRNIQRFQVAEGLKKARDLGYEYCMKWRADLYPIALNIGDLKKHISSERGGISSKIAMSAWRNLSVFPDCFSSIPDLYMFGTVECLEMVWGSGGIDYTKEINLPSFLNEQSLYRNCEDQIELFGNVYEIGKVFDAHSELYYHYKVRLEKKYNIPLSHPEICKLFIHFVSKKNVEYCWLKKGGFRPRAQAFQFAWYRQEATWNVRVQKAGWDYNHKIYYRLVSKVKTWLDVAMQKRMFSSCRNNKKRNANA